MSSGTSYKALAIETAGLEHSPGIHRNPIPLRHLWSLALAELFLLHSPRVKAEVFKHSKVSHGQIPWESWSFLSQKSHAGSRF